MVGLLQLVPRLVRRFPLLEGMCAVFFDFVMQILNGLELFQIEILAFKHLLGELVGGSTPF